MDKEKIIVPRFVAEYLDGCKRSRRNIKGVLTEFKNKERMQDGRWHALAYQLNIDNRTDYAGLTGIYRLLARAWLDGYKVEED